MKVPAVFFALLMSVCREAPALDGSHYPLTEDGVCEFRAAIWTPAFLQKHRATTLPEAEAAAIRVAREKCKDGMILLINDQAGARENITNSAMNVARALCKVQDIERTQRKDAHDFLINDFRCPISKIGSSVFADRPPN